MLPEFAFAPPVWEAEHFDEGRWAKAVAGSDRCIARLQELGAHMVVGARPVAKRGRRFNEGFLWSGRTGYRALRRKHFLPDEAGGWEANGFNRGGNAFPLFQHGPLRFGLNICTELWALETYANYARQGVHAVITPRASAAATTAKWLAAGTVAAVRTGAFGISSNRVHADGSCGGVGWIISPDGELLASTSSDTPFHTVDIDFAASDAAKATYPRYVFAAEI